VSNDGGQTATDVAVALVLEVDGVRAQAQRLVIDYLPGHSEATGAFVVPEGGAGARLAIEGYLDP
jgi:uncharacterized protein (TIGR02588 family)